LLGIALAAATAVLATNKRVVSHLADAPAHAAAFPVHMPIFGFADVEAPEIAQDSEAVKSLPGEILGWWVHISTTHVCCVHGKSLHGLL
jgi:hypothetical protein